MKMIGWDDEFGGLRLVGSGCGRAEANWRSQESYLISNHLELIDYFSMRFLNVPPIMPPFHFPYCN